MNDCGFVPLEKITHDVVPTELQSAATVVINEFLEAERAKAEYLAAYRANYKPNNLGNYVGNRRRLREFFRNYKSTRIEGTKP